jgi:hypothetical protein
MSDPTPTKPTTLTLEIPAELGPVLMQVYDAASRFVAAQLNQAGLQGAQGSAQVLSQIAQLAQITQAALPQEGAKQ